MSWLVPADLLTPEILAERDKLKPLDLPAEVERFGADTVGGLGVSVPALTYGWLPRPTVRRGASTLAE